MTLVTLSVDLDPAELRALHFAAAITDGVFDQIREEHGDEPGEMAAGRKVMPLQSAQMKIEAALLGAGEELL